MGSDLCVCFVIECVLVEDKGIYRYRFFNGVVVVLCVLFTCDTIK